MEQRVINAMRFALCSKLLRVFISGYNGGLPDKDFFRGLLAQREHC